MYLQARLIKNNFSGKITKTKFVEWEKIDLLFLSLPNGEAQKLIKKLYYKYSNLKFIDLSADFRIENASKYKSLYMAWLRILSSKFLTDG